MINPPLEPQQLDLFPLDENLAAAQQAFSESLRRQVQSMNIKATAAQVNVAAQQVQPLASVSQNIPIVRTPEERAYYLLHGEKEEGDSGVDDLMEDLIALGVDDLRILQSNSVWTVECRLAIMHRPNKQFGQYGGASGSFKSWNEPVMKSYLRMEVSAALSLREALRELLLASQLYASTKAVHGGGRRA